jgi:hypothetical protein
MAWSKEAGATMQWAEISTLALTKTNDIELVTLKTHLVIEDALRHLLATRLGLQAEALAEEAR